MVSAPDLLDRLDRETRAEAGLLVASPVVDRTDRIDRIEREAAAPEALVHAVAVIHRALDDALAAASDPRLAGLVARAPARPTPTDADSPVGSIAGLIGELLAQQVRLHAATDPIALCGDAYALTALAAIVPAAGRPTAPALARVRLDVAELARVIRAAREALAGLGALLRAVHATADGPDVLHAINREAGTHPVTGDPRELQAVLRAAERSWRRFPYYAARFGERGLRFTRSDSAWLVTVTGHGPQVAERQVMWLGRVLASRGMPQWLLELHLDVLYDELVEVSPEQRAAHVDLQRAAQTMRDIRCRQLAEDRFIALGESFDRRVDPTWRARLPETGGLLVAAVIDEQLGIGRAVGSLAGWLTDPARFPSPWIDAVHATLDAARREVAEVAKVAELAKVAEVAEVAKVAELADAHRPDPAASRRRGHASL